jgi:hypothetical protein
MLEVGSASVKHVVLLLMPESSRAMLVRKETLLHEVLAVLVGASSARLLASPGRGSYCLVHFALERALNDTTINSQSSSGGG